jgi:hypothetical protein
MRKFARWLLPVFAACMFAACGGGGDGHSLEGTWNGFLWAVGPFTLVIDGSGDITEVLVNGSPSTTILGGSVVGGPGIYTMTWVLDPEGAVSFPFLTDEEQLQESEGEHLHGSILFMFGLETIIGTVERDGSTTTTYYQSDILGSWSGYGYGYSQKALDFAPFSPVTVEGTADDPNDRFVVTLPVGSISGVLTTSFGPYYPGTAVTGADVRILMSPDKQYVTGQALPQDYDSVEEITFYSLRRDP